MGRRQQRTAENLNPSDMRDVIGEYAPADAAQARAAIARGAGSVAELGGGHASRSAPTSLDRVGSEILARKDELGRPAVARGRQDAARGHRRSRCARRRSSSSSPARRCALAGEKLPSVRPGIDVEITREPVGVVGLITPWNFPIAIPAWKIAPALAYGNTVVFKPADLVPGCAWALAEILSRAGLPAGVFNLVMGRGSVVGEALRQRSRASRRISFTGSVGTGRKMARREGRRARWRRSSSRWAARTRWSCSTTPTSTTAVNCAIQGAYYSTGQRCTAVVAADRHRGHPRPLRRGDDRAS